MSLLLIAMRIYNIFVFFNSATAVKHGLPTGLTVIQFMYRSTYVASYS